MKNAMTYKGYTASMKFDSDDRILVGRVLHIDDIISFHGDSIAKFEAAFHDSVDCYLASCEKLEQVFGRKTTPQPNRMC
jgi:predicted HicB family RNase H-like nuclease